MIALRRQRRPLRTLTQAAFSVAILTVLALLRPGAPSLPRSLSAPLTVETIEGVIVWLLWLAFGFLALAFLVNALRSRPRSAVVNVPSSRRPSERPLRTVRQPRQPLPSLVVVSPQPASDRPDNDRTNGCTAVREEGTIERTAPTSDVPIRARVSVLGPLTIAGAKRSRRGLRAAALELIAYLALNRRSVQRDELLEAFWPGVDPRRSRPRLHQAVRDARRLLGAAIVSERDCYSLDRGEVDVDLDELERLLAEVRLTEEEQAEQRLLEQALALFVDEPFAGSDYRWSEGELRRLRAIHIELLERVGGFRLARGEPGRALELAERALTLDSLNEGLWRLALEAERALGLREALDERYEQLRVLVAERLGLEPERETRALYRKLLGQS